MLITKRDKSGYNKHSKNAKYSSPKIRSIVRTASDMTILKRRGRNLLTFCYGFKIIITIFLNHFGSRIKIQAVSNGSRVLNWFQNSTEPYLSFKTKRWMTVMLVTSLCWWLFDGDWLQMLVAESLCWRLSSLCWWFTQFIKSLTNVTKRTCFQ